MSSTGIPFSEFMRHVDEAQSGGDSLQGLSAAFQAYAQNVAHPAALLDIGLVYLALNKPYAELLGQPPSALVGKEYSRAHRGGTKVSCAMLKAVIDGVPQEHPLALPLPAPGGRRYRTRCVTPLKNAAAHALGMLLEYYPEGDGACGETE
jgi:PAS domain-containing protein